jgi:Helix-turn-helix domain/Protein of unknown function (DUF1580)
VIDLVSEEQLRLEQAARICKVHYTSAYRWVLRGVPGPDGRRIRLEALRVGRKWVTTAAALQRFAEATTPQLDNVSVIPPRTANARRRAAERAGARLAKIGI